MLGQVNKKKDDEDVRKRTLQSAYNTYGPAGRGITKAALSVKDIGQSFKGKGVPLANAVTKPLDSYTPNSTAGFESNPNSTSIGDMARSAGGAIKSGAKSALNAVRQGPTPGPSLGQALNTNNVQTGTSEGPSYLEQQGGFTPDPTSTGSTRHPLDTGVTQGPAFGPYTSQQAPQNVQTVPTPIEPTLVPQAPQAPTAESAFTAGPTYRGASFTDRGFGPGKVAGGFGSRGISTGGPRTISAPKTMGDMLRYNRESKAQRDNAAMEDAANKTGIAAFNANRQAEDDNARINLAQSNQAMTGEHYARTDDAADTRNTLLGQAEENRNAIAQGNLDSLTNVREEQALTSKEKRTGSVAQRNQQEAEAQSALAMDPNNTALQARVQAFTAPPAAITAAQSAKLSQAEMKSYLDFYKSLQGNSLAPIDPDIAMDKFRQTQRNLQGRSNPVDQYFQ